MNKFDNKYSQFSALEIVLMFISNPSNSVNFIKLRGGVWNLGKYNHEVAELKMITLQGNSILKSSYVTCSNFWTLVYGNNYALLQCCSEDIFVLQFNMSMEVLSLSMNITKIKNLPYLTFTSKWCNNNSLFKQYITILSN